MGISVLISSYKSQSGWGSELFELTSYIYKLTPQNPEPLYFWQKFIDLILAFSFFQDMR